MNAGFVQRERGEAQIYELKGKTNFLDNFKDWSFFHNTSG
jgi:hypothetical protein